MIYLREADVAALLSMPVAIEALREAFQQLGQGAADNVPRVRAQASGIVLHSMSAAADYLGLVGWKQYTTTRSKVQFLVGVYEQKSGDLVALIEADRLGQVRTGATTGLAVSLLAPRTTRLGLFGSGWQAESQLQAVATVCPLEQVLVYSRKADRLNQFCSRMSDQCQLDVRPAESAEHAVRDQQLIVTATTSSKPVFNGDWLNDDAVVCAVGSNWLGKAEIDRTTIQKSNLIVCDSIEACRAEAGDFVPSLEAGEFDWAQAVELARLAVDPRGQATDSVTIFKSVGMALEDLAVAAKVLQAYYAQQAAVLR